MILNIENNFKFARKKIRQKLMPRGYLKKILLKRREDQIALSSFSQVVHQKLEEDHAEKDFFFLSFIVGKHVALDCISYNRVFCQMSSQVRF